MPPIPCVQSGNGLVDTPASTLEWEESGDDTARPSDRVGSLPHRMESILQGDTHRWPWSTKEKCFHIICFELLAAMLVVKTLSKDQEHKHVLLLLDNQTAVAYINNLGRTVSAQATYLAREIYGCGA